MLRSTPEYAAAHRHDQAAHASSTEVAAFLAVRRAERRRQFGNFISSIWRALPRPSAGVNDAIPADPELST